MLRDVGRVLEMPYGQVDKLCKLVPNNPASPVTLAQAIDDEPRLQAARDAEPVVRRAFDIALKLEGLHRHASTHAAGIVIGDRPLAELVPLYRDPRSDMPVTQFNMKWVEQAGLVKFDFLGLKTLTVLRHRGEACRAARHRHRSARASRSTTRRPTRCWRAARRSACSSWKVQGMRRALLDMQPDRFEDIIALVALYRPGPMANIPTYCARKHGKEQPEYIHPKLEPVLRETFGVIVYQEQVMQAAQVLAGYSLGEADLLRRAMGKKIRSEMEAQRERFVEGAVERGIERGQAEAIFELLERFADYGFNKSHAAAYALVAYQTAYLKANYPVEFLAASMTLDMGNTDKLSEFRAEAQRLGIKVEPPSVNRSGVTFEVEATPSTMRSPRSRASARRRSRRSSRRAATGRSATSPTSPAASIRARVNKRVLESLAAAGAFDALEPDRARALRGRRRDPGGGAAPHEAPRWGRASCSAAGRSREQLPLPAVEPWLPAERLQREFDAIGFFLSGHPLDDYAAALKRLRVQSWAEFSARGEAGRDRRPRRRHRGGAHRAAHQDRQQDGHLRTVRPVRPLRGGHVRRRACSSIRDLLEPGSAVLLMLIGGSAGRRRARAHPDGRAARPGGREAAEGPARVPARSERRSKASPSGSSRRRPRRAKGRRRGQHDPDARRRPEVEVKLPGRFKVSPQIAGAIKAVPGVVQVEAV